MSTRVLLFKTNSEQNLYIKFKIRKRRKFEKTKEFIKKMKEVYEEVEEILRKSQEKIKKYANRKENKPKEYRVDDWMLKSTKNLKFQMQKRHLEKLMEQFVGSYKVKRIISTNAIKLEYSENISSSKYQQSINI